jgi:glycine cleavage system H protein
VAPEGAVQVGLDDFAKKLLGPVDAIDFPNVGMTVKAGQPLFGVRQKHRRIQFNAPVSGRVVKTNAALAEDTEALEWTPYQRNWVCVIDADNLDRELPQLTIGNSAVALYEEDIERFRRMMKEMATDGPEGGLDDALYRGELQQLDDAHADRLVKAFFTR